MSRNSIKNEPTEVKNQTIVILLNLKIMKKILTQLVLLSLCAIVQAQSWSGTVPTEYDYNDQTMVWASLTVENGSGSGYVIGAFIDDVCRGESELMTSPTDGSPIYVITVRGNNDESDLGKAITFKVYDPGTGLEYPITLNTTAPITFEHEKTYGYPSGSIGMSVTVPTSYKLIFSEAEVGKAYELTESLQIKPTEATLPLNLEWSVTPTEAAAAVSLKGSTLTAQMTYPSSLTLSVSGPGNPTAGPSAPLASCEFQIIRHADAITLVQTEKQITINDVAELNAFLKQGISYQLNPGDATDEVLWEANTNNSLVWNGTGFDIVGGGEAQIRPYIMIGEQKLVPKDLNGKEEWITVTVFVPVTSIDVSYTLWGGGDDSFLANMGDEHIYERLLKMINVYPKNATDTTYTISIVDGDGTVIKKEGETLVPLSAGPCVLRITSNYNALSAVPKTADVNLTIENPATDAIILKPIIDVILTDGQSKDISNEVCNNVTWNGDTGNLAAGSYVMVSGTTGSVTGSGSIGKTSIEGTFTAVKEGLSSILMNLVWYDYDSWGITSNELKTKNNSPMFIINVQNYLTLSRFEVAVSNPVAGENCMIILTPKPEGATFDPADITLSFHNGYDESTEWGQKFKLVQTAPPALFYQVTSEIPCHAFIEVKNGAKLVPLNDSEATQYAFQIGYPMTFETGWQWRCNPWGFVSTNDLETVYSKSMIELRTSNKLVYNDPAWGLFGTLMSTPGIQQTQCYKINMGTMEEPQTTVFYSVTDNTQIMNWNAEQKKYIIPMKPGWNWVGTPYFFAHDVSSIFESPSELDGVVIIGKTGSTEFGSGTWNGDLSEIKPNQGYIFYNPSTETKNLVLKPEDQIVVNAAPAGVKGLAPLRQIWEYDHTRFMNNMSVVAELEDIAHPEQYSIGAFVGDECRGEGVIKNGKAFITVHCDAGEYVTFKLYSPYTNDFYTVDEGLKAVTRVGSLKAPYKLHSTGVVDGIRSVASSSDDASAETYDLSGRRVNNQQQGVAIRRTADGKVRKVIKK